MCPSGNIYKKTKGSTLYTVNSVNSPEESILTTNRYCSLQKRSFLFREFKQNSELSVITALNLSLQIFVKNWWGMKKGKTFPLQPNLPLLYMSSKNVLLTLS